jgi:hypothetical protein
MTDRTHPDSGRIITSGDVINDLHDTIARREAVIKLLEKDAHDAYTQLANARGTRKVLWNLLGECLPVIDALMQIPGDDDSDAHLNGLAGRINDARTVVQAEELPGATP